MSLHMPELTISEAILSVMKEAGVPLTPAEAYERIVAKSLYEFHAQRPLSVVISQIRRHCKDLEFPTAAPTKLFGISPDGKFFPLPTPIKPARRSPTTMSVVSDAKQTLNSTLRQMKQLQRVHRELVKTRIVRDLKRLPPASFEDFSKRLLEVYGFESLFVTAVSKDGGIDGYGKLKVGLAYMNVAFQCKRWTKSNVGRPEIDKFRGAIQGEYEQGIFFTTAHFAAGAKEVSIKRGAVPVILVDGPSIADLMLDKGFGVEQESLSVYTYALDSIFEDYSQGDRP